MNETEKKDFEKMKKQIALLIREKSKDEKTIRSLRAELHNLKMQVNRLGHAANKGYV